MDKAKYIDHTYLKPEARKKDIDKLISEAKKYGFKTVCINSSWVRYAAEKLEETNVGITSVVGFPLGAMITQAKAQEAKLAIEHGASEIDMVIQIGKLKDGEENYVLNDINKVKTAIGNHILKVIVETALLTEKEIKLAAKIVKKSNAEFIKTSTGFSFRGASKEDIRIFKEILGNTKEIKAAGGIKTQQDLDDMINLGATRIGTSSGVKLIKKEHIDKSY